MLSLLSSCARRTVSVSEQTLKQRLDCLEPCYHASLRLLTAACMSYPMCRAASPGRGLGGKVALSVMIIAVGMGRGFVVVHPRNQLVLYRRASSVTWRHFHQQIIDGLAGGASTSKDKTMLRMKAVGDSHTEKIRICRRRFNELVVAMFVWSQVLVIDFVNSSNVLTIFSDAKVCRSSLRSCSSSTGGDEGY
jgi:hypothetical protein